MSNQPEKKTNKKDINIIKLKKGETVNISKALGSSKRLEILRQLSEAELNLSEIAEKVESTPQAVYHHLQILEKSRLIHVVREENIKNMDKKIKFYRSNYQPDAINLLLWAPLDQIESTELQTRVPIPDRPVERIARKIAEAIFTDKNEFKLEILTGVLKGLVTNTHESMITLKNDYEIDIETKLWNLLLLFSELSTLNAFKKLVEEEKTKTLFEDLVMSIAEEKQEFLTGYDEELS